MPFYILMYRTIEYNRLWKCFVNNHACLLLLKFVSGHTCNFYFVFYLLAVKDQYTDDKFVERVEVEVSREEVDMIEKSFADNIGLGNCLVLQGEE